MTGTIHACDALAGLQRQFLAQMRGRGPDGGIEARLAGGRMPTALGLGIYGNAYGSRLREALEHDHPVLGTYLGDELWERMCDGYIAMHPSRVRSLRNFGAGLPGYLASTDPFGAHPQLAELARFERCLLDGFDAADGERLVWGDLLGLPQLAWPTLQLQFHPSFQLYQAGFNSVETWQAIKAGQAPAPVTAVRSHWAMWRDEERVSRFRSLDDDEHAAVDHFLQRRDFSGLCEKLLERVSAAEVPTRAVGFVQAWCADGWLSRLY